jgi:hypothetical protein
MSAPKTTENLPAIPADATPTQAIASDASVLAILPTDDEWADVSAGDMTDDGTGRIPYMGLDRRITGGFIHPDTGEVTGEMHFIWLAKGKSRAQWNKPFGGKDAAAAPDCRSFDGITSDPTSPDRKATECATCPFSQWDGDEPPKCKESVEAMIALPDPLGHVRLARVRFGGIAVAPAKSYWDSFFTRLPRRPPIAYVSKAVLEPVDTDNGKFLRPRFERLADIPRSEAQPLIAERDQRLADWKADIADAVVRGDVAEDHVPAPAGGSEAGTYTGENGEFSDEPF